MSLRVRFYGGLTILAVITSLTALYHLYEIRSIRAELQEVQEDAIPSVVLADRMVVATVEVQQWLTDVSVTGDRSGYSDAETARTEFKTALAEFRKLRGNEKLMDFDALQKEFDRYYDLGSEMTEAYLTQGQAGGNRSMRRFDAQADSIAERVGKLRTQSLSHVDASSADIKKSVSLAWYSNIIQLIITLILILAAAIGMYRGFIVPVYALRDSLRTALQENDLGARIPAGNAEEMRQIASWVNAFIESVSFLVLQVKEQSVLVQSQTNDLERSSSRLSTEAEHLAASTEEGSAALEELAAAAENVGERAERLALVSKRIEENVRNLGKSIHEISRNMDQARSISNEALTRAAAGRRSMDEGLVTMEHVQERAERIHEVVGVINGISERTSLLALNASIEAARAGDLGRGFAVVASEISKLADHAATSAEEIARLIEETSTEMKSSSESVRGVLGILTGLEDGTRQMAAAFEQIGESLKSQDRSAVEITKEASEIVDSSGDIDQAMREQRKTTQEISAGVETSSNSSRILAEDADRLNRIVGQIRNLMLMAERVLSRFKMPEVGRVLQWSESYSVGVPQMDAEHAKIFEIMNQLTWMVKEGGSDAEQMRHLMDDLSEYCKFHLSSEEQFMHDHRYPALDEHMQLHADFVKTVEGYGARIHDGEDLRFLAFEMCGTIWLWLTNHILVEDRKYGTFINSRRALQSGPR
ncbi:MAG TPA: bacteriohemerythrin [Leptospiraceae bacterium]|nr:bacteriohemerythrin [Leptospirales bacterium]HMX57230.1 bacteriohemerythrin [Leptospiraceae bacterium]HMY46653.1 bacteriohemerythrin [Leptospiraceae bacterium]HNE22255.1 bacteriohemerythrin [Leptospiraceae bacterium]HNJ02729.1 bacteriohemerythrin [Leptospiraceae bacterium]